jgi:3-hydroxybutyryl-CoA dehydrogenase
MRGIEAVETVGVVGAGTMGAGIAQVAATAGYDVVVTDVDGEALDGGRERIADSLDRLVRRGDVERAAASDALERVRWTTDGGDHAAGDVVVEAVAEDLATKESVFGRLDDVCEPGVVLASNISTLSVTALAAATGRPSLVVGLHFMNPVPLMAGLEVVVAEQTAQETVAFAHEFAASLGKETWEADDRPGFVTNRILLPWINEGIRAHEEGVADREDIDRGMRLGTNVPMGPLELADHVGLDVCLDATETLHRELGDRYAPAYLLRRKVSAGHLGRETGRGFYRYEDGENLVDEQP